MSGLGELLRDVAAEAGPYDVTDRAVRAVRRRRRLAVVAPLAAALLVVAGTVASVPLRPDGADEALVWSNEVSWLPTRLVPVAKPPPLPADRGVAPAVLAYETGDAVFPETLFTEDGGHYRVPGNGVLSISPDGRWLVFRRGETLALRDLTGTAVRDLGVDQWGTVGAWSPDGRWLALRTPTGAGAVRHTVVVGVDSGETFPGLPDPHRDTRVCGLLDAGDVLTCTADGKTPRFVVRWVDPRTGGETRRVTVEPGAAMTAAERQADWVSPLAGPGVDALPRPDGRTLLTRMSEYVPDEGVTRPGDILAIDLDRPRARPRRYDLPTATLGEPYPANGGTAYGGADIHLGVAVAGEGILVTHHVPQRRAPTARDVVAELKLLAPDTGRLSRVTRVAGRAYQVIVRGQPQFE